MVEVKELMESIRTWADEDPDLEAKKTRTKITGLRYRTGEAEAADIDLSSSEGPPPKVELRASVAIGETDAGSTLGNSPSERDERLRSIARDIEVGRAGPLRCIVKGKGKAKRIEISYPLHPGLSRQSFMAAVGEIAKASAQAQSVFGALANVLAFVQASPDEAVAPSTDLSSELAEPTGAMPAGEPVAATQPIASQGGPPARPPETSATAWSATHVAPPEGLQAWSQPDPGSQSTNLQAGTELRVVQRLGDWAQVSAVNGWIGWVDGRRLVGRGPG